MRLEQSTGSSKALTCKAQTVIVTHFTISIISLVLLILFLLTRFLLGVAIIITTYSIVGPMCYYYFCMLYCSCRIKLTIIITIIVIIISICELC